MYVHVHVYVYVSDHHMLDALLMGLLPVTKSENPKSYQLNQVCTLIHV